jgi:cobalt-zinc-cadmium efflux system outer membrane protein
MAMTFAWSRALLLVGASTLAVPVRAAPRADAASRDALRVASVLDDDHALADRLARVHPDVGAARARVAEQQAAIGIASRLLPNPALTFESTGAIGDRNPLTLSQGDTMSYSVGLSQTIEIAKRGPRVDAETLREAATEQAFRDTLAGRVAAAREALARVVYLDERQRILDARVKSANDVAALEKARLVHGDISGVDYDRLVLDAFSAEQRAADNRADGRLALADCAAALLVSTCTPEGASMDAVDAAAPAPSALPDLAPALARRPDVRALRLASQAAEADARGFRRLAIPDPTLGLAYTRDFLTFAGDQPNTLTLSLSIPIPMFQHGTYEARQAVGQATELDRMAESLEARARADAESLLARRRILEQKLASLEKGAVPRSHAVVDSMQQAYEHGQVSMTDVLLVRRDDVALQLDVTDTRFALFSIRSQLRRVLGLDATELAGWGYR